MLINSACIKHRKQKIQKNELPTGALTDQKEVALFHNNKTYSSEVVGEFTSSSVSAWQVRGYEINKTICYISRFPGKSNVPKLQVYYGHFEYGSMLKGGNKI